MVEAALQKLIDAGGADTLLAAFQSPDIAVREWALQNVGTVLVRQGIVTDADPIIRAVRSGDAAVRQVLMTLIGESGDPHSGRLIVNALANAFATRDRKAADKATKALRSLGAEEPQLLIDGLTHDVAEVRWAIARLLGDVGTHEAIPALTEALNDPDEGVREAASVALERIESPSS